jgi:hypothetical protein
VREQRIWWIGELCEESISDYERRSVLSMDHSPNHSQSEAKRIDRFEQEMSIGDVVVAGHGSKMVFARLQSEAIRRPGPRCIQSVRSAIWANGNEDWEGSFLESAVSAITPFEMVEDLPLVEVQTILGSLPNDLINQGEQLNIGRNPASLPPPELPTLYQSPFSGNIIRDFRWREYLAANPDVAAAGDGEAYAFRHFFHQGYYERRIFDPKRLEGFDPGFYRERYPELGLPTDGAAQIHYCYHGWYEHRIPNRESEWLYEAGLHVYQMGKVGSHSIAAALQAAGYELGVVHLHWATDIMTAYPSNRLPYARILVHQRETPVKVISATREIVSWTLSGLFQYHGDAMLNAADARALIEEHFWNLCNSGLRWFDHRYYCGLDVYAHPFDHAKGYARIDHAGLELLIYRQEDLHRMEDHIAKFLSIPSLRLMQQNVGERKQYSEMYATMLKNARLPRSLLDELYATPFMRHFYSDAERTKALSRWLAI